MTTEITVDELMHLYVDTTLEEQENHYPLSNVDLFSNFAFLHYDNLVNEMSKYAAEQVLAQKPADEVNDERIFFWVHAARIDAELCHLLAEMEGTSASADKARNVIAGYDLWLATGDMPSEFPDEENRNWATPQCGSRQQWHDVVRLMLWKRYGREYVDIIDDMYPRG